MHAVDIFAETNPAFCSLILLSFCNGYFQEAKQPVPLPLAVLPIPLILSGDTFETFQGTNVNTGFFAWVDRNPSILIQLACRIEESMDFVKPALEFALSKKIIEFSETASIIPRSENTSNFSNAPGVNIYFKVALRLGKWMGQINSVKTIYNHLGIEL